MLLHQRKPACLCLFLCTLLLAPIPGSIAAEADTQAIRFGVLSIAPPKRIHESWQPFLSYVSERLGQSVGIVVPRGFGAMKSAVEKGEVDFFYINSHVFYRLKSAGKAVGVAQMQNISGSTISTSVFVVRANSGIASLDALKGRSIAFVSPMGAGGYLAPRAYLYREGIASGEQIEEVFTKNLTNSLRMVLLGDVAAATMCGVNYRLMSKKIDTGELKIIGTSNAYPENLITARKALPNELIERFTDIVTHMKDEDSGKLYRLIQ